MNIFNKSKTIVIKIGSSLLIDSVNSAIRENWLKEIILEIAKLNQSGKRIVIVTSGAIALGKMRLNLKRKPLLLEEKQAAAACGQIKLIESYQRLFDEHEIITAQILLTLEDSDSRKRFLNARNTLETLLNSGAIPVINENDTVATSEIRVGDNDRLAARVAEMIGADLLILLSDIDGLYTSDPRKNSDSTHIPIIEKINDQILKMAGGVGSNVGSGGMITKIHAAKIAADSGCSTIIADGRENNSLNQLVNGKAKYSIFKAQESDLSARQRWIANHLNISGFVIVDEGAENAIKTRKSLLPAGIKKIEGGFERGATISIRNEQNIEIARGLASYNSEEIFKIMGSKSSEIESILGYIRSDYVVYSDDLILTKSNIKIGEKLVNAGMLTSEQRDELLKAQADLKARDIAIRLGELAAKNGFGTQEKIEIIMGYLNQRAENRDWK